jgi:hypothetical protein
VTNPDINREIALFFGWRVHIEGQVPYISNFEKPDWDKRSGTIPDYCNDLNATHEAEKRLMRQNWGSYVYYVVTLNGKYTVSGACPSSDDLFVFIHSSARRRCEAILRTIGKWKD